VGTAFIAFVAPGADIPRIGQIPSALPNLVLPAIRAELIPDMLSSAFMLAVLGSIDSLLTSLVADNITGEQHDSDKELRGQGLGNTLAGLVGGLPGAGATMRTVVNVRAGGKTPLSGVIHALILLVIALGLGFLFESIPQAVLAGILIKVGVDIIDWPFLKRLHRLPAFPVFLMLLVLGLTVFVDLITAVLVGVFIKNLVTLDKLSNLELGSVVMADGREPVDGLTPEEEAYLAQHPGETLLIKVTGPLSYAVGRRIVQRVKAFKDHSRLIIDLADASLVGISTAMVLEEIIDKALNAGMPVKLIGATGKAEAELRQLGIPEKLGDNNLSDNFQHAVGSN
jgi:SulP family sulfate permease